MQNKRRLYKHLLIIYVFYFAALIAGFAAGIPDFIRGFNEGFNDSYFVTKDADGGNLFSYTTTAPIALAGMESFQIAGMPKGVEVSGGELDLRVQTQEPTTPFSEYRWMANNGYCFLLLMILAGLFLAIFILIAKIINSLRRSIRDELPFRHRIIGQTRAIGILILTSELCETLVKYINIKAAAQVLAGSPFEVVSSFPISYWNVIMGILILFMAEVLSIGAQLSEEQQLTI